MTGAADGFATLTFTYDSDGNVKSSATSGPGSGQPTVLLSYTYDAAGSETSLTDNLSSAGVTTLTYDLDERVSQIASAYGGTAGPQVAFNYDPASRMTSALRTVGGTGTSVNTSYSYDGAGRQTTITHQAVTTTSGGGGTTTTPLATYVYSYDNADRVTSEKDAEGTASFTYDSANELTTVTGSRSESYTYDLNGNRTGTGYSTTVMNETATSPGTTYTYDNAGNMVSANNGSSITTYTYDYRNRLTDVTQGGTIIASYTYDALNRRIGIDDNSSHTWTVYDGTNPYADFNGSGTLQERYLFGPGVVTGAVVDELLARTSSGGTTAWYLPDQLGSVRDIVSTSGTELDHVVYDSFGNILTETNAANGDRFKFAGMEYDSATAQFYDRARNYDQTIGRFTSQDPLGFGSGDVDLYAYTGNGPPNATDPTGLMPQDPGESGEPNQEGVKQQSGTGSGRQKAGGSQGHGGSGTQSVAPRSSLVPPPGYDGHSYTPGQNPVNRKSEPVSHEPRPMLVPPSLTKPSRKPPVQKAYPGDPIRETTQYMIAYFKWRADVAAWQKREDLRQSIIERNEILKDNKEAEEAIDTKQTKETQEQPKS